MKYNPTIVNQFFLDADIPPAVFEYKFHATRRWRFDLCWPDKKLAVEVDGGIWVAGGHNRGAQIKKDWEKRNTATTMGWRILYCEPRDLCTAATVKMVKECFN